ncbi:carbon storage regulator [Sutcliffiella cohnii]|uniref:Translational regulator CsrA n=1 Tax=Sutcliffiella cohnii TaxID=33932 RepID=A0A223KV23_9BACI|nr:carbon storage regulator CsrA [Sutcliffiella cohnii]AST93339.1 carbon storage regulator [Sutcliffiella cohnii]
MLILTRKLNETIVIDENIEITIQSIDGEQVKIGVKAPKEIEIYRKEVLEAIQNENKNAISRKIDIKKLK